MSEPQYLIASLRDFLNVPPEKLADCLRDFAVWCEITRTGQMQNAVSSATNGEAIFHDDKFLWIDDGIAGLAVPGWIPVVDIHNGAVVNVPVEVKP